jgi:hypothetical protein
MRCGHATPFMKEPVKRKIEGATVTDATCMHIQTLTGLVLTGRGVPGVSARTEVGYA